MKPLKPAPAALLIPALLLLGSWGCSPMRRTPPAALHSAVSTAQANAQQTAAKQATAPPTSPPEQSFPEQSFPEQVVRGQDGGGYSLPPAFEVGADAGRHSRSPLPVSGQPDARLAQELNAAQGYGSPSRYSNALPAPSQLDAAQVASESALPMPYRAAQPPTPPSFQSGGVAPLPAPTPYSQPYNGPPIQVAPPATAPFAGGTVFGDPVYDGTTFAPAPYMPRDNVADLIINGAPGRTGRIMLGGAVNSDAGVTAQVTIDERNFDIRRWPTSFQDLVSGTAFRGDGQSLRIEAVPGSVFQRYSIQFGEPNLFDTNVSMNVSGFLYDRRFQDWDESRIGGRVALGYRITPDLSMSLGVQGQNVELENPRVPGVVEIDKYIGKHNLYAGQFKLVHDTRNSPFAASQGHLLEWNFEQAFGDFDFPKAELDYRRHFLVRQRADGSGKHTLTMGTQLGVTGDDTPVFENFFAGGYATLRGFEFRGASPTVNTAQVGGRFSWISSVEYMAPITADDAFRAVAFVDFGTVERDFDINSENFRVAPGFGFRVAIPAMGPAPLAFDFAFPVLHADTDERQVFSFYMSAAR